MLIYLPRLWIDLELITPEGYYANFTDLGQCPDLGQWLVLLPLVCESRFLVPLKVVKHSGGIYSDLILF